MDERDVIFTRMRYKEGNIDFADYYERRPEKLEIDNYLRSLPHIGDKENKLYDLHKHTFVDSGFEFISKLAVFNNAFATTLPQETNPQETTEFVKRVIHEMGGRAKITKLSKECFYTKKGRPITEYSKEIDTDYKYAIVFSMPMDLNNINKAPYPDEMLSTTYQYMQGAIISLWISMYLNKLGYKAKANFDGNYDTILPIIAQKAGLGKLGQHGLLLDEFHGSRVRLGAVLTNIPLVEDAPSNWDPKPVCEQCNLCKEKCLANAFYDRVQGTSVLEHEKCYERWCIYGTDCAYCIKVCPFTHPLYKEYKDKLTNSDAITEFLTKHKEINL